MAQIRLGRYEAEEGELPPLCLRCGAPAMLFKAKLLSWQPSWTYVVFGLTFWPILVATLALRRRMRVLVPFCQKHRNYWRGRRLLSWAVFSALLIFFLCLITLAATLDEPASRFPSPFLLFWLAGMVITFAMEFVHAGAIRATEITDRPTIDAWAASLGNEPPGTFHLFRVDVAEASHLRAEGDHLVIEWWDEGTGYHSVNRQ